MNLLERIDNEGLKENITAFNVGDTVSVHFKIVEGNKERVQVFEGLVIARKNGGIRETFTVRKISFGIGVERTFPVHSPRIEKIVVVRQGDVRRAKLYYIRDLSGKAATRVKEKKHIVTAAKSEKGAKTADKKTEKSVTDKVAADKGAKSAKSDKKTEKTTAVKEKAADVKINKAAAEKSAAENVTKVIEDKKSNGAETDTKSESDKK